MNLGDTPYHRFYPILGQRLNLCLVLVLAYALADLISFYSLVPAISVILKIDQLDNSDLIIFPINRDSIPFVLIILFFLKGFFTFLLFRYIAYLRAELTLRLKTNYLEIRYSENPTLFYAKPKGTFLNEVNEQVNRFGLSFFQFFQVIIALISSVVFLIVSLVVAPEFGLALGFISAVMLLSFQALNKRVASSSKILKKTSDDILKELSILYETYKYQVVTRARGYFRASLDASLIRYSETQNIIGKLEAVTLALKEPIIIIIVLLSLFLSMQYFDKEPARLLMSLLLMYKSANHFFQFQRARQNFNEYHNAITRFDEYHASSYSEPFQPDFNIQAENSHLVSGDSLTMSFAENHLFRNLSFKFPLTGCVGLVGRSGSGKTTFIDILMGLRSPTRGNLTFSKNVRFAYMQQSTFLTSDSLYDDVKIGRDIKQEDIDTLATRINLKVIGEAEFRPSGGELQRINFLREYFSDADILVLDEPTSALDSSTEAKVLQLIDELKIDKLIILVTHHEKLLECCDQIINIEEFR